MTLPAALFGLMVALLLGGLYHLMRGGGGWRLFMYLGLSVMGLAAGHLLGAWRGWNIFMLGSLDLGMGILGSILFMAGGDWLSHTEKKQSRV